MADQQDAPLGPKAQDLLRLLMQREALRFGDFTLKSGRKSPYFVNTGTLHQGADLAVFGAAYAEAIAAQVPDCTVVFGPAYKGIPLALAAAQALQAQLERPVSWAYDRKVAKTHGDGGSIVGAPLGPETSLVVVDDVLTAGTALRETLEKLQPLGVRIRAAVVAVDRQEPGLHAPSARQEIEADFGIPVFPLMSISQAVSALVHPGLPGVPVLDQVLAQRIQDHLRRE